MAAPSAWGPVGGGRTTTVVIVVVMLQLMFSVLLLVTVNQRLRGIQVVAAAGGVHDIIIEGNTLPMGQQLAGGSVADRTADRSLRAHLESPQAIIGSGADEVGTHQQSGRASRAQRRGHAAASGAQASDADAADAASGAGSGTGVLRTLCCSDNGIEYSKRYWVDTAAECCNNMTVTGMRLAVLDHLKSKEFRQQLVESFKKPQGGGAPAVPGDECPCEADRTRITRGIVIPTGGGHVHVYTHMYASACVHAGGSWESLAVAGACTTRQGLGWGGCGLRVWRVGKQVGQHALRIVECACQAHPHATGRYQQSLLLPLRWPLATPHPVPTLGSCVAGAHALSMTGA